MAWSGMWSADVDRAPCARLRGSGLQPYGALVTPGGVLRSEVRRPARRWPPELRFESPPVATLRDPACLSLAALPFLFVRGDPEPKSRRLGVRGSLGAPTPTWPTRRRGGGAGVRSARPSPAAWSADAHERALTWPRRRRPAPSSRPPLHRTNQRRRRRRGGDARGGAYAACRVSRAGGGRRPASAEAAAAAEGRRRGTRGGATGRARAARLSAAAASPQPGRRAPQRVRGL